MTKKRTPKDPNRPKNWPTSDYSSGYSRPPEHGKIKPGEVRNPWGPKGKPKPEQVDPFELAANQMTTVTIGGETMQVTAEVASHLVNFASAIGGNTKAHDIVTRERRSRRSAGPPAPTAEELLKQAQEEEQKKVASAKLVTTMNFYANFLKLGVLEIKDTGVRFAPWIIEAVGDYREKLGASRDPHIGEKWDPNHVPADENEAG